MRQKLIMDAKDAKCPFFCAHGNCFIVCEGTIPDTTSKTQFRKTTDKDLHYKIFCCWKWRNCEQARSVQENYRE